MGNSVEMCIAEESCPMERSDSRKAPDLEDSKCGWEALYHAAILENDPLRLLERIEIAEEVMLVRTRDLTNHREGSIKEREALTRALHMLSLLRQASRKTNLGSPEGS
jgi:hypothetical protein